jgi:alanine racemase
MIFSRPTQLEINLENIAHNTRLLKQHIGKTELMAVVKAEAYGHGAFKVSETSLSNGATWLGVATIDEAITLREEGFSVPIFMLGGILASESVLCSRYKIDVSTYSSNFIRQIDAYSDKFESPLRVHIKIDTGMHRLGIYPEELQEFLMEIMTRKNIEIVGICTHFPNASHDLELCARQLSTFDRCVLEAEAVIGKIPYKHAANSAAIFTVDHSHYDLVRAGLALYGYHDDAIIGKAAKTKFALSWKTRITSVRQVKALEPVGYDGTYIPKQNSTIATIPVGYADGYKRAFSNKGMVLVHGRKVRISGRVCMDQTMIDVTGIDNIIEGDEVILLGEQGNEEINVYDMCNWAETIPNDILTSIKNRGAQIYI